MPKTRCNSRRCRALARSGTRDNSGRWVALRMVAGQPARRLPHPSPSPAAAAPRRRSAATFSARTRRLGVRRSMLRAAAGMFGISFALVAAVVGEALAVVALGAKFVTVDPQTTQLPRRHTRSRLETRARRVSATAVTVLLEEIVFSTRSPRLLERAVRARRPAPRRPRTTTVAGGTETLQRTALLESEAASPEAMAVRTSVRVSIEAEAALETLVTECLAARQEMEGREPQPRSQGVRSATAAGAAGAARQTGAARLEGQRRTGVVQAAQTAALELRPQRIAAGAAAHQVMARRLPETAAPAR